MAPIHVRIVTTEVNAQNFDFVIGLNFMVSPFFGIKITKIKIDATSATTPPNLEGMDRRTTYANRKYHSG